MKVKFINYGYSLIEVMIAIAVLGVVAAAMAALWENMANMTIRSKANQAADALARDVQSILNQPEACDNALHAVGPDLIWDFTVQPTVQVDRIETTGGLVVLRRGLPVPANAVLTLEDMFLREPVNDPGFTWEGAISRVGRTIGRVNPFIAPVAKTIVVAKLVMRFRHTSPVATYQLRDRTANVTVVVDDATKKVEFCFLNRPIEARNFVCDIGLANSCEPPVGPAVPAGCVVVYYISGFTQSAEPICACKVTCGGTSGATGGP